MTDPIDVKCWLGKTSTGPCQIQGYTARPLPVVLGLSHAVSGAWKTTTLKQRVQKTPTDRYLGIWVFP